MHIIYIQIYRLGLNMKWMLVTLVSKKIYNQKYSSVRMRWYMLPTFYIGI